MNDPTPTDLQVILDKMPSPEQLRLLVDIFATLADTTRARMIFALSQQSLCVGDLAAIAGISESATSHQLRLLKDRRLVSTRRQGTRIFYSLAQHHLAALFREAEYTADHLVHNIPDHPYPMP
ncbi:MAG: metalloregulator ArsR/SmtB family transcription factor [Anaerolineaceae bacterium]|nr:metalloregulator ArsR/SmtB family transcription factor [Anaerolineaceae bacterium]